MKYSFYEKIILNTISMGVYRNDSKNQKHKIQYNFVYAMNFRESFSKFYKIL